MRESISPKRWLFFHEGINIAQTLAVEAAEGADALVDYQLKH